MSEIREVIINNDRLATDEYLVNMGPQHPSTHGVLRLLVRLEGEKVLNVQPHTGYIHSGIGWRFGTPLVEVTNHERKYYA